MATIADANDCIGNLEHHIHRVFAAVRVAGEDFVYCTTNDLFARLDDYCDELTISETKKPLLIKGESGAGKTALLANWLHRRENANIRHRSSTDEFIFWHAVGCSRQSLSVNALLRRLISDLKLRFELARQIPKSQERLSWELPRFLELAAKKGRVIIVIDGLHRLLNNEGTEDGLAWLPLELPANVRIILSVTVPASMLVEQVEQETQDNPVNFLNPAMHNPSFTLMAGNKEEVNQSISITETTEPLKRNRILIELERRQVPSLTLKALDKTVCRSLVDAYIEKSISHETSKIATGPFVTDLLKMRNGEESLATDFIPGFLLFDSQLTRLLKHDLGGNPLYLRLFLRCLHLVCSRGYSAWAVFDRWIKATTVQDLISRILATCEEGFRRTNEQAQRDCELTINAGGMPALKMLYAWHPSFRLDDNLASSRDISQFNNSHTDNNGNGLRGSVDFSRGAQGNNENNGNGVSRNSFMEPVDNTHHLDGTSKLSKEGAFNDMTQAKENVPLSNQVVQNLGDQRWITIEKQAQRQLLKAVAESKRLVEDVCTAKAEFKQVNYDSHFISEVVNKIKVNQENALIDPDQDDEEEAIDDNFSDESQSYKSGAIYMNSQLNESGSEDEDEESWVDGRSHTSQTVGSHAASHDHLSKSSHHLQSIPTRQVMEGILSSNSDENLNKHNTEAKTVESSNKVESNTPNAAGNTTKNNTANVLNSTASSSVSSGAPRRMSALTGPNINGTNTNTALVHGESALFTVHTENNKVIVSSVNRRATADPVEGFNLLPLYMRGGQTVPGFGEILGNALSLLFVARQGLKANELWKILSDLEINRRRQQRYFNEKRDQIAKNELTVCRVASKLIEHQAALEDLLRAEDNTRSKYVYKNTMINTLKKYFSGDFSVNDFLLVLEFIIKHIFEDTNDQKQEETLNKSKSTTSKINLLGFEDEPLLRADDIHFIQFFVILNKLNRKFHFSQRSSGKAYLGKSHRYKGSLYADNHNSHQHHNNGHGPGSFEDADEFDDFHVNFGEKNDKQHDTSNKEQLEEDQDEVLGPVVEESLLQILCALGVLYSPENKVLILPRDSEAFRQTIFEHYVLPRGNGTIQYWHNLIIQYFRTQPNSLRKCEEMPWHLKICRKWTLLKDSLVDLKTFDLMFNNNLKDELMEYWRLLTEGPLPVQDKPQDGTQSRGLLTRGNAPAYGTGSTAMKGSTSNNNNNNNNQDDDDDNQSTFSHILKDIDEAIVNKISLKEVKKRAMQFQMQPFDVVEELNRSLELWISTERPAPININRTITHIARFLLEFSKFTHSCPQFRRLGIDMEVLQRFGITFEELKDVLPVIGGNKNQGQQQTNNNSPINREQMIHDDNGDDDAEFIGGSSKNNDNLLSPTKKRSKKPQRYFDNFGDKKETPQFPTNQMLAGNLYLYLRWIWIQFPWLALLPAATVALKDREMVRNGMNYSINQIHKGAKDEKEKPGTAEEVENDAEVDDQVMVDSGMKHLMRVWNVKKSDPTIPVFVNSMNRKLAAIKPRTSLSTSLERNVDASCRKLYAELTAPSHMAQVRLGIGYQQRDKFRRTFQQEMEMSKSMPFAYHGKKVEKSGSLFPTYSALVRESNKKKLEADLLLTEENESINGDNSSMQSNSILSLKRKRLQASKFNLDKALKFATSPAEVPSGNAAPSGVFLTELDDEIRRLNHEEYMNSHRAMEGSGALIKDEEDLEYVTTLDRIARLKTVLNKLSIIQKEKDRTINALEKEIILRQDADQYLLNEVHNGEALMMSLHERNVTMEKNLEEATLLQEGYASLLKALKNNPPFNEDHVKALEVEVELANKQFEDLCAHRRKLYLDGEKLDNIKKQQLLERIQYFQNARQEVAIKKKQVVKEIKHLKEALQTGDRRRYDRENQRSKRSAGNTDKSNNRKRTANSKGAKRITGDRKLRTKGKNKETNNDDYSDELSEGSDSSNEDLDHNNNSITLTQPVISFLNAIVRKVTYEPIIRDSDKSFDDVKKRANENEQQRIEEEYAEQQRKEAEAELEEAEAAAALSRAAKNTLNNLTGNNNNNNNNNNPNNNGNNSNNNTNNPNSSANSLSQAGVADKHHSAVKSNNAILPPKPIVINTGLRDNDSESNISITSNANSLTNSQSHHYHHHHHPAHRVNFAHESHLNNLNPGSLLSKRRFSQDEMQQLKDSIKSMFQGQNATTPVAQDTNRMEFKSQLQQAMHLLFQRTESNSFEEFLDRYMQGQALLETLRSQQVLVDSHLAQLRAEHNELYAVWSDISFLAEERKAGNENITEGNAPPTESNEATDRYLDNQLFEKEVRMNHFRRMYEKTVHTISEVRTAIGHVMNLLAVNAKLLSALPQTEVPPLESDQDMPQCLSWLEDRIIALNEALAMDANRPNAANNEEHSKPMSQRQTELASQIQQMLYDKKNRGANFKSNRKQQGALSKVLISSSDSSAFVSSPRAVRIDPAGKVDKIYDSKMVKLQNERDKQAELSEAQTFFSRENNSQNEVQRFLAEGLNRKHTKDMSRKAKLLVNRREGRATSYGLVLEELLDSRGQVFQFPPEKVMTSKSSESPTKTK